MAKVHLHYPYKRLPFKSVKSIKTLVQTLFLEEGLVLDRLDYIFCSDTFLLELNKIHLEHDFFTDIITFDLSKSSTYIAGECYISLDRVQENAKLYHKPYVDEVLRVIIHGALHLCGFKDKTKSEIAGIRLREDHYLHQFAQRLNA